MRSAAGWRIDPGQTGCGIPALNHTQECGFEPASTILPERPMTMTASPATGDPLAAHAAAAAHPTRLEEMPISFFAIVMGLSGITLSTRAAEHALALGPVASPWLMWATVGVMGLISLFYLLKLLVHPKAVAAEWNHPVRIAFFPAISISMLLIAAILVPVMPDIARPLWLTGAALQAALTLSVVASWIGHRPFTHAHLNPAWFIPAVGNIVAPLAGGPLGFIELSWLFFSAGLVFWIVLLTLVFNRLVFHDPLPGRLVPTLVILIAPPAVAFVAWLRLGHEVDALARILLNAGYLFLGVVLTQATKLFRLPFALSWWALTFPVAALAIASLLFAEATGSAVHEGIGLALWGALLAIGAGLVLRTLLAMARGEICKPE
jgi:tellurite resistance protein